MKIHELVNAGFTRREIADRMSIGIHKVDKILQVVGVRTKRGGHKVAKFTYKKTYIKELQCYMNDLRRYSNKSPELRLHLFNVENEVKELTDLHCEDKIPIRTRDIKRPQNWKPVVVTINEKA